MTEAKVYIVVHGHFYQPPRENPYLNFIEQQDSASPFHDWNERIFYECYRPNAHARIHNQAGDVLEIINNYEYLSFNMGPTLLSWLEQYDPSTYEQIIEADQRSAVRLNGHGNAIAQVYNHVIMPLATWRDKLTQIRWGKADFRHRFGRDPEGMWLAETAIDYETVEALIQEGIKFTVLAPSQALRVRPLASDGQDEPTGWLEVGGGQIDPTRPYRCFLKNRQEYLDIFFYDGPISRDMGFGDLLSSSYGFACRLGQAIQGDRPYQIIAVATDGETFGHHKHFTEKSLAYAFVHEFPQRGWQVTNFAHYLSLHPPEWEVELKPVTAWSCAHGVDRWQDDCGCGAELGKGKWRKPLREALNWLRDQLHHIYQNLAPNYFQDPWAVRDEYIEVILDRCRWQEFWCRHGKGDLDDPKRQWDAIRLLEMARHSLLMFTSCGWFFEEISRPEGVQILRYAGRAIDLAADVAGVLLEAEFMAKLALAPSNVATYGNGANLYKQCVQTAKVSTERVAAQFAILALFCPENGTSRHFYGYQVQTKDYSDRQIGILRLGIMHLVLTSTITLEQQEYSIAVLHVGNTDCHCVLQLYRGRKAYEEMKQVLWQALSTGSSAQVILTMQEYLGECHFNLQSLIREERHRLLKQIARQTLNHLDQVYMEVYRDNAPLLAVFGKEGLTPPPELKAAAQIALNNQFQQELQQLQQGNFSVLSRLENIFLEAQTLNCELEHNYTQTVISQLLRQEIDHLRHDELVGSSLKKILALLNLAMGIELSLNIEILQEEFLEYLRSQVVTACPQVVQVVNCKTEYPALPICDRFSNEELQQINQIAEHLQIAPSAWLRLG
ncbi:MAG: DUF3536 domain-containing protein [Pseudanabaenaceae cyanobacterium]